MLRLLLAFAGSVVLLASGCSSSSPAAAVAGPVDGTYTLTSESCAGSTVTAADGSVLAVTNTTGVVTSPALTDGCITTYGIVLVYSGTNGISATQDSKSCSTGCSGGECTANTTTQTATTGTYVLSGSTLTVTLTNFDCNTYGGGGTQTDVKVYTKH